MPRAPRIQACQATSENTSRLVMAIRTMAVAIATESGSHSFWTSVTCVIAGWGSSQPCPIARRERRESLRPWRAGRGAKGAAVSRHHRGDDRAVLERRSVALREDEPGQLTVVARNARPPHERLAEQS